MRNFIVILLISFSSLVFSADEVTVNNGQIIEIDIKGMACPFCLDGLNRKLNNLSVVEQAGVSLKMKKAQITVKKGKSLGEDLLRKTIIDSGFTPGDMRVIE